MNDMQIDLKFDGIDIGKVSINLTEATVVEKALMLASQSVAVDGNCPCALGAPPVRSDCNHGLDVCEKYELKNCWREFYIQQARKQISTGED